MLPRYPGRVTVLWADDEPLNRPGDAIDVWQVTGGAIDLHRSLGRHIICVTRHGATVVERIRACMDATQVDSRSATR